MRARPVGRSVEDAAVLSTLEVERYSAAIGNGLLDDLLIRRSRQKFCVLAFSSCWHIPLRDC